jgi:signal transduction histidine kinase
LGASSAGVLGLVVAAVMVVSAPWTLWLVSREIVEPLDDLERAASRIAGGDYRPKFMPSPVREISRVQTALTAMARQLAERQQELNDSYDALAEAYESLERANRDIEQLAQVKADFVAVAAHEIRAPLATIRLYADLLESGELGRLDEGAARAVDAIGAAAKRLGSITADLMDSALLERGLLPIRLEPMRIDRVVSEAVRDAEPAADARSMELRLSGPVEETTIIGDALRIRQVLDNLVSNAIKYSSEGAAVDVRMTAQPDWVTIDVTDRGRGIAESDRGRLFTLFGRIDFGDSREAAGLGLGLAISARIAQAHGGSVSFRANEEGVGSVFSLRLPVTGPAGANGEGVAIRVVGEEEQP